MAKTKYIFLFSPNKLSLKLILITNLIERIKVISERIIKITPKITEIVQKVFVTASLFSIEFLVPQSAIINNNVK